MEAQGTRPASIDEEGTTDDSSRRAFQLCLLAILLPVLGVVFVWFQALKHWRMPLGQESRWTRMLVALALLDTVVAICMVTVFVTERPESSSSLPGWIGVSLNPNQHEGVVVREIVPGSPADQAGIRPMDEILRVDNTSIRSLEELRSAVAPVGVPRSVDIRREGDELRLSVIPRALPKQELTLFQALPSDAPAIGALLRRAAYTLITPLLVGGFWLWSYMRGSKSLNRDWAWIIAAMIASQATSMATETLVYRIFHGWTPGGAILSDMAATAISMLIGIVALGRPRIGASVPKTVGLGLLYWLSTVPRAGGLIAGSVLLGGGESFPERIGALDYFAPYSLDAVSRLLLFLNVVLLGPLAEEVVYRGLLLPALLRAFGPVSAVVLSSLVFAYAHDGYGPMTIQVFAAGLVLGWARLYSRGLAAPILLHVLFNAVASVWILF